MDQQTSRITRIEKQYTELVEFVLIDEVALRSKEFVEFVDKSF
ncbi:hypothetical protein LX69_02431 [Breznakibacter xylanolyticus]|uniref:Uncharacterized protein n=1 Tax=Breznakibacter xylanolyticus TaxID=990 RepID=A0A2W7N2Y1_9BACT|nr:hypothetical protein LX69_02431 [Breznakibacter xylanolyticus]